MLDANALTLEQYIESHLEEALREKYIKVFYQPVVRTVSRQLCGLEALARWEAPGWGLLPPASFVGILERSRRIHLLDSFIVREVCAGYRSAVENRGVVVPVSINLSRLDFEQCDMFSVVEAAATEHKVPRNFLCIEITESSLSDSDAFMRECIFRFQDAGYQVWMDDFGSGYSSLNVLKDYHFDELKVDMEFLSDFHVRSREILSSIVHMAKEIDIQTLVEGVETEEQFQFLRNIGCEKVQGYLFGKPMPYRDCIRHVISSGIGVESPAHRKYYDDIGRINVLSATPFLSSQDRHLQSSSGREKNSIPLAMAELRGEDVRILFTNAAFDEAAAAMDWEAFFGVPLDQSLHNMPLHLRQLSAHVAKFLEETRISGTGKMYFVNHDEYYEVQGKRVASCPDICSVLLRMDNLTRGAEITRQEALDEGLRQIYAVYERVAILDLTQDTTTLLYQDATPVNGPDTDGNLKEQLHRYAREEIFPEDRDRYLALTDPDTLEERTLKTSGNYLSAYLRTRSFHGRYLWKLYSLLRLREGVYFLLVRDAREEMRDIQKIVGMCAGQDAAFHALGASDDAASVDTGSGEAPASHAADKAAPASGSPAMGSARRTLHGRESEKAPFEPDDAAFSPEAMWWNITHNSTIKFFWKDLNRRFLGCSQSFLDFYGFDSENAILGKTDEEMGWHLHPDLYQSDEWDVLREGIATHDILGNCIVRGENRNIIASKMPLYDSEGSIIGLFGYFAPVDAAARSSGEADRRGRLDPLTGVLNARALDEELYAYRDEYDLRKQDFARIHVSIGDFSEINRQYGFQFGDNLIRTLGSALLHCCGTAASVARQISCEFVILFQFHEQDELEELLSRIRLIPSVVRDVQGIPFTLYLSMGWSVFSETESTEEQSTRARFRLAADGGFNGQNEESARIFHMYDNLPLACVVFRVWQDADGINGLILYCNQAYQALSGIEPKKAMGQEISHAFPMLEPRWYEIGYQAAFLGESVVETLRYSLMERNLHVTASPIVGPGYCLMTFQPAPGDVGPDEADRRRGRYPKGDGTQSGNGRHPGSGRISADTETAADGTEC